MLKTKSFLCLDFGAGSLKAAEFEPAESGVLRLRQFGIRPLGFEGSQEVARERVLVKAVQELIAERGFSARDINACAPGFHVFSKFVKLPPVDSSKVTQIIQYEAQQNVPFPLDDVVWDYQILGTTPSGELEVLLVAIKTDIVEGLFRTAETSGLRIQLVDVSPAALCNAFRYNYGDLEGCTMLLDVGAKTSNLLFFEKGKVYSRGINIGANSITQDFAAESKLKFAEAEQLKIAEGFVSLGGAYEEPENPRQAQISKIARQVMTRLHIQVNQTIQFYRGQQGGSPPERLFLAGGASVMAYTAQFFAEKLNLPVEYFNPFRNVQIDPAINLEELAGVAHSFGEVVGLGLRNVAQCPVEMNLMPKSSLQRQQFNQKKPYFAATLCSSALVVLAWGWFYSQMASLKKETKTEISAQVEPLKQTEARLKTEERKLEQFKNESSQLGDWIGQRFFWSDVLGELARVLQQTEALRKEDMGGVENGVWIESFTSASPALSGLAEESAAGGEEPSQRMAMSLAMMRRYGLIPRDMVAPAEAAAPAAGTAPADGTTTAPADGTTAAPADGTTAAPADGTAPADGSAPAAKPAAATNEVAVINVQCRGLNLKKTDPAANDKLAFELEKQLQASPLFDPKETKLTGEKIVEEGALTFTFKVQLKLKRPLKL